LWQPLLAIFSVYCYLARGRKNSVQNFVPFHFASEVLGEFSLPQIDYPVPAEFVPKLTAAKGDMPLDMLLYWMQLKSASPGVDWRGMEAAMQRLVQLLTMHLGCAPAIIETEAWSLEFAAVPLDQEIVTVERDGYLLAALRPDAAGKLVVASFRPLDAQSLRLLMQLSARPHPHHGVAMRPDNWEYVLDRAVAIDNFYASDRDEPYLSHFSFGISGDEANATAPARTASQFRVFCQFEGG
jgi:hypothetical protein